MTRTLYAIMSRQNGQILDVVRSWDEACDTIAAWEESDMQDGVYSPGNYYISEYTDADDKCVNCAFFASCRDLDEPSHEDPACIMFARKEVEP